MTDLSEKSVYPLVLLVNEKLSEKGEKGDIFALEDKSALFPIN